MALIIKTADIDPAFAEELSNVGILTSVRGMTMRIVNLGSPRVRKPDEKKYVMEAHRTIIPYFDVSNRIPVADKAFITSASLYFDEPLSMNRFINARVITSIFLWPATTYCLISARVFEEDTSRYQCSYCVKHAKIRISREENKHYENTFVVCSDGQTMCYSCLRVCRSAKGKFVVHGPRRELARSAVREKLYTEIEKGYRLLSIVYPNEIQYVLLIGADYYITNMPARQDIYDKYIAPRKRLRITHGVYMHLFGDSRLIFLVNPPDAIPADAVVQTEANLLAEMMMECM